MAQYQRTPSQGLKILENLYQDNPNHQGIINNLINAYIFFGIHDKAMYIIADIPNNRVDIPSLKFKAWVEHKQGNIEKEIEIWDSILDKSFYMEYEGILGDIFQRDNKEITIKPNDIPLFCVVHNEMLRLPFFLKHYRNLGVTKFFFVDNNSDDGSFEFLLQQPDCYLFWSNSSYNKAGHGQVWGQYLINKYVLDNQWFLVIDADEFLVYPNCERQPLTVLIKYLNKNNCTAVNSFMLDMFPESLQKQLQIKQGDDLIKESPYFYNNYQLIHQMESPYHTFLGGIFGYFNYNKCLAVTPLFKKTNPRIKFLASRHITTPTILPKLSTTILHFKFLGNFHNHAINETKRKEHWASGRAYKVYDNIHKRKINKNFNFTDLPKTTKYQNSQQLVDLGLIQCPDDWEKFIKNETYNEK